MTKRGPRRQWKQPQSQPREEREASPMTVDSDSRLLTRTGRARIRYCFKSTSKPDRATLAALMGTNVSAIDKVLANRYNRSTDNTNEDDQCISPRFKDWFKQMYNNPRYLSSETKKSAQKNVCVDKKPAKPSEIPDATDSISQTQPNNNSRKRKLNLNSDDDNDTKTQSAVPASKRSRHEDPPSQSIPAVELPPQSQPVPPQPSKLSKKLKKFFRTIGYRDQTAVLSRLAQCGTTESFILSMQGLVVNIVASRLQTLNSLMETDGSINGKFKPAELELLAFKITSATDSDWSILSDVALHFNLAGPGIIRFCVIYSQNL